MPASEKRKAWLKTLWWSAAFVALALLAGGFGLQQRYGAWTAVSPDPQTAYLKGYIAMSDSEKAKRRGNKWQALDEAIKGRMTLESVKRKHPGWQPGMVDFRLNRSRKECRERLKDIVLFR